MIKVSGIVIAGKFLDFVFRKVADLIQPNKPPLLIDTTLFKLLKSVRVQLELLCNVELVVTSSMIFQSSQDLKVLWCHANVKGILCLIKDIIL
jgi:hypothetical protein